MSVHKFTEAESQFFEAMEHISPMRAETQATALQTFKSFLFIFFLLASILCVRRSLIFA